LELGSGISSFVIAFALRELEDGCKPTFYSMEEDRYYHNQIVEIFPSDLKDSVHFVLSDRFEKDFGMYRGCYYKDVPDLPWDFVFIDGPTEDDRFKHEDNRSRTRRCILADFLNVLHRSKRNVNALLDQKITTLWAYKKLLNAKISYNPIVKMTSIQGASKDSLSLL
jgi:hypothetical protein